MTKNKVKINCIDFQTFLKIIEIIKNINAIVTFIKYVYIFVKHFGTLFVKYFQSVSKTLRAYLQFIAILLGIRTPESDLIKEYLSAYLKTLRHLKFSSSHVHVSKDYVSHMFSQP